MVPYMQFHVLLVYQINVLAPDVLKDNFYEHILIHSYLEHITSILYWYGFL